MIFTIKMHWKWFLLKKCIGNDFFYENTSEIIFTIKYIVNTFYYKKCNRNDFSYKNAPGNMK